MQLRLDDRFASLEARIPRQLGFVGHVWAEAAPQTDEDEENNKCKHGAETKSEGIVEHLWATCCKHELGTKSEGIVEHLRAEVAPKSDEDEEDNFSKHDVETKSEGVVEHLRAEAAPKTIEEEEEEEVVEKEASAEKEGHAAHAHVYDDAQWRAMNAQI